MHELTGCANTGAKTSTVKLILIFVVFIDSIKPQNLVKIKRHK